MFKDLERNYFSFVNYEIINTLEVQSIRAYTEQLKKIIDGIPNFKVAYSLGVFNDLSSALQYVISNYGYFDKNLAYILHQSVINGLRLTNNTVLNLENY
jgi:hypothetical protein